MDVRADRMRRRGRLPSWLTIGGPTLALALAVGLLSWPGHPRVLGLIGLGALGVGLLGVSRWVRR